jgi:hypothetical protein
MSISFYDVDMKRQHAAMLDLCKRVCAADLRDDESLLSFHIAAIYDFLTSIGVEIDETYDLEKEYGKD